MQNDIWPIHYLCQGWRLCCLPRQGRSSYLAGPRLHTFYGLLPSLLSPPLLSPSLPLLLHSPSPPFPLEVGPLNTARGLGVHCKLPQCGLGRN